jgi:hypothetical protein
MAKIFFVFLLLGHFAFAQQNISFSKSQMYADFDSMTSNILRASPRIIFKKELWNYDVKKHFKKLRTSIDTISNDFSYYLLLCKTLQVAQDGHIDPWHQQDDWANKQAQILKKVRNKFKLSIPNTYINGKYIIREPFIINDDTIKIGTEITHINKLKIDNYLLQHLTDEWYEYDMEHHNFFYSGFFNNLTTIFQDTITLTFKNNNAPSKTYKLAINQPTKWLPDNGIRNQDTTRVEYWNKEKILYIRLTRMDPKYKPYLKNEISKCKEDKLNIEKIIIDIRNNPGGQDNVWQSLFAELLADTITYPLKIDDFPNGFVTREIVEKTGIKVEGFFKPDNSFLLKKYGLVTLVDTKESLPPSPTSIKFKGNIYLLAEDIFSSAGSALSVANKSSTDNLISVGRKTGSFLGIGFSPIVFTLPNTRFKYRAAPSIEVTNIKKLEDLMQYNLEIEVPYSIEEFKIRDSYAGSTSSKEYLILYDNFIKTVLRHKPSR